MLFHGQFLQPQARRLVGVGRHLRRLLRAVVPCSGSSGNRDHGEEIWNPGLRSRHEVRTVSFIPIAAARLASAKELLPPPLVVRFQS